jgi:hypothetical protein
LARYPVKSGGAIVIAPPFFELWEWINRRVDHALRAVRVEQTMDSRQERIVPPLKEIMFSAIHSVVRVFLMW